MVHALLSKEPNRRPSTKAIILNHTVQKVALMHRIKLPYHPKDVLLPDSGGISINYQALRDAMSKPKQTSKDIKSHYT